MLDREKMLFRVYADKELFDKIKNICFNLSHMNSIVQNDIVISGKDIKEHSIEFKSLIAELENWNKDVIKHIVKKENIVTEKDLEEN